MYNDILTQYKSHILKEVKLPIVNLIRHDNDSHINVKIAYDKAKENFYIYMNDDDGIMPRGCIRDLSLSEAQVLELYNFIGKYYLNKETTND